MSDDKINSNFFEKVNLLNSYWAGLFAADGCIYERGNSKRFSLTFKESDKILLERLKKDLQYKGNITYFKYDNPNYEARVSLCFTNNKICSDLKKNFNITSKKTLTLNPPEIKDINALSYIVGYIDGDGCISRYRNNKYLKVKILGTKELLLWIKNIFIEHFPELGLDNLNIQSYGKISSFEIHCKKAEEVLKRLKALDIPKLERKWQKL